LFVYKITNTVNGKVYIGITTKSVRSRWKAHLCNAFVKNVNYYLYKAMRKYGKEAFLIETIHEAASLADLLEAEKRFITECNSYATANGYNQTLGGEGVFGLKWKPEALEKMRARVKAWYEAGNPHPMQGKKHSDEARRKMSESAKNKPPVGEETRRKLSVAAIGRKMPREAVERARQKRLGVKRTPEQIERIRLGRRNGKVPRKHRGNSKYPVGYVLGALARVKAGEKQTHVAKDLGIDQGYLSQLLNRKRGPSLIGA
jgi:group I intron endonuclease